MPTNVININESTLKNFVESLRPEDPEIREKLDIWYSFKNNTIEIYEIRPAWDNPKEILHSPFVKIRHYKSKNSWSIYWMTGDLKWKSYAPFPKSSNLTTLFELIKEDKFGCFFG